MGVFLFGCKLVATFLEFAHLPGPFDASYGHASRLAWYWIGKATPTLACVAFLIDATVCLRDRRATVFWTAALVVVAAVTITVVWLGARGYGWNIFDLLRR